eukprot:scaffold21420_cov129-Isochrysis_galbana.AAC.2
MAHGTCGGRAEYASSQTQTTAHTHQSATQTQTYLEPSPPRFSLGRHLQHNARSRARNSKVPWVGFDISICCWERNAPGMSHADTRTPLHGHTGGVPSDKALSDTLKARARTFGAPAPGGSWGCPGPAPAPSTRHTTPAADTHSAQLAYMLSAPRGCAVCGVVTRISSRPSSSRAARRENRRHMPKPKRVRSRQPPSLPNQRMHEC